MPEPFSAADAHAAVAVDYDGTLAPIVRDPALAVPLPAARDALGALADRIDLVAVVSGRPIAFLRTHLALANVALVGQYGLERLIDGEIVVDDRALASLDAVRDAAAVAERTWPNLFIERKGDVAFTVHWRTAPDAAPQSGDLAALAMDHGLVFQPARLAGEIRPLVPTDKGMALEALLDHGHRYTSVAFVGDDDADVAAFDALDRMRRGELDRGDELQIMKVAVRSDEAPPELLARADAMVDGPVGVAAFLSSLALR